MFLTVLSGFNHSVFTTERRFTSILPATTPKPRQIEYLQRREGQLCRKVFPSPTRFFCLALPPAVRSAPSHFQERSP